MDRPDVMVAKLMADESLVYIDVLPKTVTTSVSTDGIVYVTLSRTLILKARPPVNLKVHERGGVHALRSQTGCRWPGCMSRWWRMQSTS